MTRHTSKKYNNDSTSKIIEYQKPGIGFMLSDLTNVI